MVNVLHIYCIPAIKGGYGIMTSLQVGSAKSDGGRWGGKITP